MLIGTSHKSVDAKGFSLVQRCFDAVSGVVRLNLCISLRCLVRESAEGIAAQYQPAYLQDSDLCRYSVQFALSCVPDQAGWPYRGLPIGSQLQAQ